MSRGEPTAGGGRAANSSSRERQRSHPARALEEVVVARLLALLAHEQVLRHGDVDDHDLCRRGLRVSDLSLLGAAHGTPPSARAARTHRRLEERGAPAVGEGRHAQAGNAEARERDSSRELLPVERAHVRQTVGSRPAGTVAGYRNCPRAAGPQASAIPARAAACDPHSSQLTLAACLT